MTGLLHNLGSVLAFFSRLPVPSDLTTVPLSRAVAMVPLAGLVLALPAAVLMLCVSLLGGSAFVAATLAVIVLLVLTGALHEDGLADCADGFWGGATRERRLDIMRDSRIGTYGVLALVCAALLKIGLLEMAIAHNPLGAAASLVAAAVAARAVALYPWVGLPAARRDGLAVAIGQPTVATFRRVLLLGIVLTAALTAWWAPLGFLLGGLGAAGAAKLCANLADRKIDGHTGDVIGASVVLADLSYLLAFTISPF